MPNVKDLTDEQLAAINDVPITTYVNQQMIAAYPNEMMNVDDFTLDELNSYYRGSDLETLASYVRSGNIASAMRVALLLEARQVYQSERASRSGADYEKRQRDAVKSEQDRKDNYITKHTSHAWNGPRASCFVRRSDQLGGGQCQKRADFVLLVDKRPDGVALECTVHATRVPKYGSWPYYVGTEQRRSFAADHDNERWLRGVLTVIE